MSFQQMVGIIIYMYNIIMLNYISHDQKQFKMDLKLQKQILQEYGEKILQICQNLKTSKTPR